MKTFFALYMDPSSLTLELLKASRGREPNATLFHHYVERTYPQEFLFHSEDGWTAK